MKGEKILLVIAPSHFRDEEFFDTRAELEKAGFKVEVASTSTSMAIGLLGRSVKPDMLIDGVNVSEYSAIVFIGGPGVEEHLLYENSHILELANSARENGKLIAAICIAPRILARAGVVSGKKVTSFGDSETMRMLKDAGATHTGADVEQDGMLITANGPGAARAFGKAIAKALG
ncbi:MAG: DJ-1/PfpI family protein [Candidatus Micrarchaeota archaeon]|nr:DJ-1/PfpI family protein [Candidatus Micrarchaeota archaeon]